MKKVVLLVFALFAASGLSFGQQVLPNDPAVKVGKLSNGMTYYIRHNDLPAGRCEFYLATNVGAIQEAPDQDGLAHFLQHMCFNGLKNLPGKQMLEYLQHIGAEFGRNINASTGVEHTQYMLNNMPVTREGILDTCLLVMHDYSHFVLNEADEIDAERGVILEEKRTRNTAGWRMFEQSAPYLYGKDSKYAGCTIIGSEENLKTFKPESLRNFYKTWYQPDMQALIIIGDIDVDKVLAKVETLFADIPAPAQPTVKVMPEVEINQTPVVGIITDKENTSTSVEFIWKLGEPLPKQYECTNVGYTMRLMKRVVGAVMDERFEDICSKADALFLGAGMGIYKLCEPCEVVAAEMNCENAKTLEATRALLTEVEKLRRYGITDDELGRVKDDILKGLKDKVAGAATRKNPEFVYPIINHFFSGVSFLEPETDLQLATMIFSQVNAGVINQFISQVLDCNSLTVLYTGVDKEDQVHPTEEQLLAIVEEVKNADIQPNKTEAISSDFIGGRTIRAGKVKKSAEGKYASTEWTLSNGLKVVVLPTEYKKDQVIFDIRRKGGLNNIPTEDIASFDNSIVSVFSQNCGVAEFSSSTVSKMLSGKTLRVSPYISQIYNGVNGSCTPEDFETALQIAYLEYVAPRFDKEEWQVSMNQLNSVLPNLVSTPNYALQQHVYKDVFNTPRFSVISPEILEKAKLETFGKHYSKLFGDIAGATMYIVGNVDPAAIKPLVEKYCGSLPKGRKAPEWISENILDFQRGELKDVFNTKMETPKATVFQHYGADVEYSLQKEVNLDAASFILDMIYVETLREEEGGTYGASTSISITDEPRQIVEIQVFFDTNVEQQEKLREIAIAGMKKLAVEGPTEEQVTRAVENAKKNLPEKRITNSYWLNCLKLNARRGGDYDAEYEKAVNGISAEGIKAAISEILAQNNSIEVVMLPE